MQNLGPMPVLTTERLVIRPFAMDDLEVAHRLLDVDLDWSGTREEREAWLRFSIRMSEKWNNPPAGYRAIALADGGEVIGKCGYSVFLLSADERSLFGRSSRDAWRGSSLAFGLGYGLFRRFRGQGFAVEAVRALIAHAFEVLEVDALWARTMAGNHDSRRLMERVGMTTGSNPDAAAWPGIVGVLRNPDHRPVGSAPA
jgi:RimJ/RimL family protein N-acetyltransferase